MGKKKNKPILDGEGLTTLVRSLPSGVVRRGNLHEHWSRVGNAIHDAAREHSVGTIDDLIYDPVQVDSDAALVVAAEGDANLPDFALLMRDTLAAAEEPALALEDFQERVGNYFNQQLVDEEINRHGVNKLVLKLFRPYHEWYYLTDTTYDVAYSYALVEAERRCDAVWQEILEWAGDEYRRGGSYPNDAIPAQAMARLYTRSQAEEELGVARRVFKMMSGSRDLPMRRCPDGAVRMRAADVHRLRQSPEKIQAVEDQIEINIWQIRTLTDLKVSYLKTLLHNAGVRPKHRGKGKRNKSGDEYYLWGDVRQLFWPEGDHPSMLDIEINEEAGGAGSQAWWSETIIQIHEEITEKRRQQREAKQRRKEERRQQRDALRSQMIDNFPSWLREDDIDQIAYIHVGPTNSGKTHDALEELAQAGSGWYLAPLRLLAREMFERLNKMGVYCSLLTGEERIDIPGSTITAATVEMFNPNHSGECVVIDEAHMVADDSRGWAWTQALVKAQAPTLHVITAPHGLQLLTKIFESTGVETQTLYHHRLVPLEVAAKPWSLSRLPRRTILIAFTRRDVLRYKYRLQEEFGRTVSVVYGALPPEVRLKQAQRFAEQEVEICVATDAVGMGLNLPADNVVFSTMSKFDGKQMRFLYPSEVQQIAGRAGRYGLSDAGFVGGIDKQILNRVRKLMSQQVYDVKVARLAPRTDEIELLTGDLAQRLITWQQLNAIPDELRSIVTSTDMGDRIELAKMLSYEDLQRLGVERALLLVNAPTRQESQEYWVDCATAILQDQPLPLPPVSPAKIEEGRTLKLAEGVISCIDVYLWLGYREPFQHLVEDPHPVIHQREELTRAMDIALMKKFNPNTPRHSRFDESWYDYL